MHYRQHRVAAERAALERLEARLVAVQGEGALAFPPPDALLKELLPPQSLLILERPGQDPLRLLQGSPDFSSSVLRATLPTPEGGRLILEQPYSEAMSRWQSAARTVITGMVLADVLLLAFLAFLIRSATRARFWQDRCKHNEEMLVALFENANQYVALLDPMGKVLKVNQAALLRIDASLEQVLGCAFWEQRWWRPEAPHGTASTRQAVADALAGRPSRYQSLNADSAGHLYPVDVSVKPLVFEQDHVEFILVEWRDISDLVAAAQALEASRGQLMDMAASVPGVLFRLEELEPDTSALSQRFGFTFISPRFAKLFRMNPDLATLDRIADLMQPSAAFLQSLEHALQRPPRWEYLGRFIDLHGRNGWLRIKARVSEQEVDGLKRVVINGVFLDDTELIEAEEELRRAHNTLQEQEKMASLGSMVAGVAHEINTPLGVALTAASQLDKDVATISHAFSDQTLTAEQLTEFVQDASEATRLMVANCTRAADLVRSFKQVAADQSVHELRAINLKEYLDDLILSLRPQLKRTPHTLTVECPEALELVCDPGALAQIVSNLVMNSLAHAFKHSGNAGRMHLAVRPSDEPGTLVLTYQDNGAGMPEQVRRRAFDPFFTTRRGQGGTGLGLHIVYNLVVNSLGGAISLASREGEGATFTLVFPQHPVGRTPAPEPAAGTDGASP
ncbi:PAS domain-containing sensor histidine kinase [Megalodesulfovibrio paquesii]